MRVSRRAALLMPAAALAVAGLRPLGARAQSSGPLRIEITEGVIEPVALRVARFPAESGGAQDYAGRIGRVIAANLVNTGLFREIPREAHIARVTSFDASTAYADWRAINAQALITGAVGTSGNRLTVKFRLFDVFSGQQMGEGLQFGGDTANWRRMAHKVADAVYSRITGEGGYFDSRVVFVAETGPRDNRVKRLAIMDQDGANVQYLSDGRALVFAPRFSPDGGRILYTSYDTGFPRVYLMDLATMSARSLGDQPGTMTFAPRFAPNGQTVIYSLSRGGTTDLYAQSLSSGQITQLTNAPSIATAPSYAPDGRQIVFESDRSGTQQLYVMPATGGEPRRISFGEGPLRHPGLVAARRSGGLHQVASGPVPHRRDAHRRQPGAPAHGLVS
jgi:TolB protein